jgi:Helix-turn-helix domain
MAVKAPDIAKSYRRLFRGHLQDGPALRPDAPAGMRSVPDQAGIVVGIAEKAVHELSDSPEPIPSGAGFETALRYPLRRGILRLLNQAEKPLTVRELAAKLECQQGDIDRHVAILEGVGALAVAHTACHGSTAEPFYESTVGEDGGFCLVLIATQRLDEAR